ncbi:hypothetical protein [Rufibacter tibetensis]|uniref:Uncharacterized protein n=1 Tax=Rufibacter tibetensis TaxID=512763 RepID=A0A0N7HX10_9BACT|nr:hypothetical protein [Rufibacter tibetensis]ALJ00745.1 hypothetical protein DC20_19365 [Rufibacter tibetensis]
MSNIGKSKLGFYEKKIISNYITDENGIDLEEIGEKTTEINIPINIARNDFLSIRKLSYEINEVTNFLKSKQLEYRETGYDRRLLWFRVNVIDQAINQYLGIGYINIEQSWLKFIIHSLSHDKADQGGDGIFAIIDEDFHWAVSFTLSQQDLSLSIQKFEK